MESARRRAIEESCRTKPSVPLEDKMHLTMSHALRCRCKKCGRIIQWDDADPMGIITGECCKYVYRLYPFTVMVRIEDSRPEALLPPPRGDSLFAAIDADIMKNAERPLEAAPHLAPKDRAPGRTARGGVCSADPNRPPAA